MARKGLLLMLVLGCIGIGSALPPFVFARAMAPMAPPAPSEVNPSPPEQTPKIVFIHASIGEMWLVPGWGDLGTELGANNYYVSDYSMVNHSDEFPGHDYCVWPTVFGEAALMDEILHHNAIESGYERPMADPGGENEIIMIKPCGTQYPIYGDPDDPPSGQHGCPVYQLPDGSWHGTTVGNIKQALIDALEHFRQHPDKFFVLVTAPANQEDYTTHGETARAISNWMMYEWLDGYDVGNVMVFDLFNVLTSNAEGEGDPCPEDQGSSDVGLETGNHHRIWNGQVQHQVQYDQDYSAYCDNHPMAGGLLKAANELVPLLNTYYNAWNRNVGAAFSGQPRFGLPPLAVRFADGSAGNVLSRVWEFGDGDTSTLPNPTHIYSALGYYSVTLTVQYADGSDTEVRRRYIHVTDEIYQAHLPLILKDYASQNAGLRPRPR